MVVVAPAATLAHLFDLLEACDRVTDGEPVDVLAHSLQCADRLSQLAPDDRQLQLAGLFHDVGHTVAGDDGDVVDRHGDVGAALVRDVMDPDVARLIELHVPAKRYLVSVDPTHLGRLSGASGASLTAQGGPMDAAEIGSFERDPLATRAVTLRRADEAAKQATAATTPLSEWRDRAERWLA